MPWSSAWRIGWIVWSSGWIVWSSGWDALEQRMARLEGVLDGLREALFGRVAGGVRVSQGILH